MSNFIQDCISGSAKLSEIDNYIDNWHEGNSKLSLHEFLGMSIEEYAFYIQDAEFLPIIITAHKEMRDFNVIIKQELLLLSSHNAVQNKSIKLKNWLKQHGQLD